MVILRLVDIGSVVILVVGRYWVSINIGCR